MRNPKYTRHKVCLFLMIGLLIAASGCQKELVNPQEFQLTSPQEFQLFYSDTIFFSLEQNNIEWSIGVETLAQNGEPGISPNLLIDSLSWEIGFESIKGSIKSIEQGSGQYRSQGCKPWRIGLSVPPIEQKQDTISIPGCIALQTGPCLHSFTISGGVLVVVVFETLEDSSLVKSLKNVQAWKEGKPVPISKK